MTLAAALLFIVSSLASAPITSAQNAQPSEAPTASSANPASQAQPGDNESQNPPATQSVPQSSAAQATPSPTSSPRRTTNRRPHKKKAEAPPCGVSAAPAGSAPVNSTGSASAPVADPSTASTTPQTFGTPASKKDCPPPKIIVRQGGTKEPSIRLAGGPSSDQDGQKKDTINQLLGVTDQNLKKTAGMQLSTSQQDTVSQTRQFMAQSKAAMAEGDFERARTLAWKAELLSEDLAKPEK